MKLWYWAGSYASKQQHAGSDMDIGIYYREAEPFDLTPIREIAVSISVDGAPTVTGFYEWGKWVNGGAWIQTSAGKVDFLYRNIDQIQRTINDAQLGITYHDFDQQPAYGFYSIIYLAELKICIPLFDPTDVIGNFKSQILEYPKKLKEKTISGWLWAAEFTLLHARGFAQKGEIYKHSRVLNSCCFQFNPGVICLERTLFHSR